MKILVITSKYPPEYAGSGLRAHKTYLRLKKKFGIQYDVITNSIEFNNNARYVYDSVEVVRIGKKLRSTDSKGMIGKILNHFMIFLNYFYQGYFILPILLQRQYDLIHTFGDSPTIHIAMYYALLRKIALIRELCNQGTKARPVLPFKLHKLLKFRFLDWMKVISISKKITDDCVKTGVKRNKIWERPNPIDETKFKCCEDKKYIFRSKLTNFSSKDIVLLNISKFRPSKNQIFLLDVLVHLNERFKLLCCGPLVTNGPLMSRDHAYYNSILQKITDLGLQKRVEIKTGFFKNVNELYRLSDVFVFPTLVEALGTPLLESIACGIPVVANHIKGVTDIWCVDGRSGYLCNLVPEIFADRIIKSLEIKKSTLREESKRIIEAAGSNVIDKVYYKLITNLVKRSPKRL